MEALKARGLHGVEFVVSDEDVDRRDLAAWLAKWSGKYSELTGWVEENIEETLTYFRLPLAHRKHVKSAGTPQRGNQAAHLCGPNLPQCRELLEAGAGADRRGSRNLSRGPSLSEHLLKERKKAALRQA